MATNGSDFLWAVGIEDTFIPHVRPGLRRLDEYELTQHYRFWREDLALAVEAGARGLRWGVPWYRVEPAPGRWDWRWVDDVLDHAVNRLGLTVVLDLVHYGTPLWLDNSFLNGRYPERVASYAVAVARRYGS
ncbi:MAG TPA: beta-galactosidase, partial [Candidatus Limnocylindrales bacterium]|nr:beta-galactosidase [Candidatus Limnocylindrales bacterium]